MRKNDDHLVAKLLLVTQARARTPVVMTMLAQAEYALALCNDVSRTLYVVDRESPDLILVEPANAWTECLQLVFDLKTNSFTSHIPLVVLGTGGATDRTQWFNIGADTCVDTPYQPPILLAWVSSLLERSFNRDAVTKLPSVGYLHKQLDRWLANGRPTAVLYFDVDHFTEFRSTFGEEAATRAIIGLGELMVGVIPKNDDACVTHLGNDRFMAMLPLDGATTMAATLVQLFRQNRRQFYPAPYGDATYSELQHLLGQDKTIPQLSLSGVLLTSENRVLKNFVQVSAILAELMDGVKARGGDACEFA